MITFEDFYREYPKKVARQKAVLAWSHMTESEHDAALLALPNHLLFWKSKGQEWEFLPYPASWLNGKRWTDDLVFERRKEPRPETARDVRANNVATLTGRRHERTHEPDADGAVVQEFPLALRKPG